MRASKNARTACLKQAALTDRRRSLTEIVPGDLDIAGLGQLPPQLTLRNHLEPSALEMLRLDATFGRRTLVQEALEDPTSNPHSALIGAEDNTELDGAALVVPAGIFGKLKKEHRDLHGEGGNVL